MAKKIITPVRDGGESIVRGRGLLNPVPGGWWFSYIHLRKGFLWASLVVQDLPRSSDCEESACKAIPGRIPWTEEPGRLHPMGLQRVGPDWMTKTFTSFTGDPVVKNPPCNAGDTGLIPGPGRPTCLRATKPVCPSYWACALEPVLHSKRSHHNENPKHHS